MNKLRSKIKRLIGIWFSCLILSIEVAVYIVFAQAVSRPIEAQPLDLGKILSSIEVKQKTAKLQIPFIANKGQTDKTVKLYAHTFGGTVFITKKGEIVYSLPKIEGKPIKGLALKEKIVEKKPVKVLALKEELVGGRVKDVNGEEKSITKISYFKGNDPSNWKSNISTYDIVSLGEVYKGVELKLKAYGNNVEKLFYVKAGAEPENIRMKLSGGKLTVNNDGELEVGTELGTVKFTKPIAYQEVDENKELVEVTYVIKGDEYSFKVGAYDRAKELVIDPILAATFLGGTGGDESASAITLDANGNVYVAGFTNSSDFPGIGPGSAQHIRGNTGILADAYVAKLDAGLSKILAATFLGGSDPDGAPTIALDSNGNVYVAGFTDSSDFPGIGPASADSTFGPEEGFVVKMDSGLSKILAATFLGGSSFDSVSDIVLDSTGNVFVAGITQSPDFPGIGPGSADSKFGGNGEGFVAKLDSGLSKILAATFLGGSSFDAAVSIALDGNGNLYVTGTTFTSDFPGIGPASADSKFGGNGEGFVAKLDSGLSKILAATFLGGGGDEGTGPIVLDSIGNVYVVGGTRSSDFPGIGVGSADNTLGGSDDAYVAKLDSGLSKILAATFLGGSSFDQAGALALDDNGHVYVAGFTDSSDFSGIGAESADSTFADSEAFVVKLDSGLSKILAATFLGGSSFDQAGALALDDNGHVYVAGDTTSSDFSYVCPGLGSVDSTFAGGEEAFVAKLDTNLSVTPTVNNFLSFKPIDSTFKTVPSTSRCPSGFVGKFSFNARLTNISQNSSLSALVVQVNILTNGNLLQNAQGGPCGAKGAKLTVPTENGFSDGVLSPREFVDVPFVVCLKNTKNFIFLVDVLGAVK